MDITPVILSGGSGSRLWPASRVCHPKQFLSLAGERSLLQNTMRRFHGQNGFVAPLVVAGEAHRFLIADQARECGVELRGLLVEPAARNTAPAIAAAASWLLARDSEATMLVMPADHIIAKPAILADAAHAALPAALDGWLVTFGIEPKAPATGYGYIARSGEEIASGVWRAESFVEKPDAPTAERLVGAGSLWNSGLFLFRADALLAELGRFAPAIVEAARGAVEQAVADLDFVRLDKQAFEASPAASIDYAIMQESGRVAVAPVAECGWSDIGSWEALHSASLKDESGNAAVGEAVMIESERTFAYLDDGRLLATLGIADAVIVSTPDALLVADRRRSQEVGAIVDRIASIRPELVADNRRVDRPWGHYETLHVGSRHRVKHIFVKAGGRLSLQKHYHRAEHWIVVSGTARVTCDNQVREVTENQSVYLPLGCHHRLENPGCIPLSLIEVQTGSYLGEDDIERFDDVYGRPNGRSGV